MASLLVIHVLHERTKVRMSGHNGRRLGDVNQSSGQFAGLVDSELESR